MVNNAWSNAGLRGEQNTQAMLSKVAGDLKDWETNVLGDLEKRIKMLKKELEEVRRGDITQERVNREHFLREKLDRLEHQKDTHWKQRAHVKWLHDGDKNTSFFHAFASERRKRNTIKRLKREDEEPLKEHIANYFFNIFSSMAGKDNEEILHVVQPRVTKEMNDILRAEYTEEEVKRALDNIGDLKAPGPDGMPAIFFKRFWQIVGNQVTKEVLQILRGGEMPEGWNDTLIVLIPKNANPASIKDLRPISLCNVVYKLVSKVITNRLKVIIPDIISPNQSAFVPGRLISDNILLAYELTHFLQRRRSGLMGYAAVKLDMSKAYDRVEWTFLKDMMQRLGFKRCWIELIMRCVSTVKYQIKVNHDTTEIITPQRGLRQGDPLSPYLFLICAEGLSAMLHEAEMRGSLGGIKICREAPSVSHLLFADDSLLLMEAKAESAHEVNKILNSYETASGQMINKDKSSILFSTNTSQEMKKEMRSILQIKSKGLTSKYLGVPSYVGKARARCFEYMK